MKKDEGGDNSFGTASVIFGILSIVLGLFSSPLAGIALGIVGIVFSKKQRDISNNKWSSAGRTLSIVGLVVGVITFLAALFIASYLKNNPDLLAQIQGVQG